MGSSPGQEEHSPGNIHEIRTEGLALGEGILYLLAGGTIVAEGPQLCRLIRSRIPYSPAPIVRTEFKGFWIHMRFRLNNLGIAHSPACG